MVQVAPSILSADFANLHSEVGRVSNADMLHIDVMDGHFVPNISLGIPVLESLRKTTNLFLDVHLMISDPLFYAERFAKAGADLICFHYESVQDPSRVIEAIHACKKQAGMAVKPATPISVLEPYLKHLELALVMSVEPGFGGQAFQPSAVDKLSALSEMARRQNPEMRIEVDGGIDENTAALCVNAGANVLVAGSYVFGHTKPSSAIELLRRADQSASR